MQTAAFDVIGIFGFSKDFQATRDLDGEGAQACKCLSEGTRLVHPLMPAALRACRESRFLLTSKHPGERGYFAALIYKCWDDS